MELHDRLHELRKKNGYTQAELAEKLGVSRQSISNWELGTIVPSTSRLKKISGLYSVPLETLLRDDVSGEQKKDDENATNIESVSSESDPVANEDTVAKKRHKKKYALVVLAGAAILLVLGVVAFSIAMGNAEKSGTQLDQLENEEIEVPSESSFDFTFE